MNNNKLWEVILIIGILTSLMSIFWKPALAQAPILTKEQMYNQQLVLWVEKLSEKENCGNGIIDTNGRWSRGDMCFQDATFAQYSKKYGVKDQKQLAVAMISDDWENWRHWRCSVVTDYDRCPKYTWGKHIGKPPKDVFFDKNIFSGI